MERDVVELHLLRLRRTTSSGAAGRRKKKKRKFWSESCVFNIKLPVDDDEKKKTCGFNPVVVFV
jgi:hypothetical protein